MVVTIGTIYAIPNFYPTNPSIQVAYTETGKSADQSLLDRIETVLSSTTILEDGEAVTVSKYQDIFLRDNKIVIKFNDVEEQLSSKTILQQTFLDEVIVGLFLEPNTPQWLKAIRANPVKLGLDLSGGVHFLLAVDIESAQQSRLEVLLDTYRQTFDEERIKFDESESRVDKNDLNLQFKFSNYESYNRALNLIKEDSIGQKGPQYNVTERPSSNIIFLEYSDVALKEIRDYAVGQNLITLRKRVDELSVSEPVVQRQGADRIVVQLPGVQDPTAAKKIIGKTANLEFRMEANQLTGSPLRMETFDFKNDEYRSAVLETRVIVTGDRVTNANTGFDESGLPQVDITLDMEGGKAIQKATTGNVGRRLGVLFVEQKSKSELVPNESGELVIQQTPYIEKQIISILESKIRPAVARDGGDIKFQEFKDGKVKVLLKGSCSGCPSSTLTLKKGVENLLCHYIPEVKEVLAV